MKATIHGATIASDSLDTTISNESNHSASKWSRKFGQFSRSPEEKPTSRFWGKDGFTPDMNSIRAIALCLKEAQRLVYSIIVSLADHSMDC